jgi:pimeloyl-ACP methyl ester carboxylesterase
MSVETTVRLAGLVGDDQGEPDSRPPIVLLHGLSFDRRMWGPATTALRQIDPGRRTIAFDLPGHGESPGWDSYDVNSLAQGVHRAVTEANLDPPVIVGHSMSAVVATIYGARFPTAAVVNVDQPLEVAPFANLVKSLAGKLRGQEFPGVWEMFASSMHKELLPPDAQRLLNSGTPDQALILAYWRQVLETTPEELVAMADAVAAELSAKRTPYLFVAGADLDAQQRRILNELLPQIALAVLPGSGHFPHLAHPERFAELLATCATARA